MPGQTIAGGGYTVQHILNDTGITSTVLATDHEAFDRIVVIKALYSAPNLHNPRIALAVQERFAAEARTLATLRHPAIPQVYSYFQDGAYSYLVMEHTEGHTLAQQLVSINHTQSQISAGRVYTYQHVVQWGVALCRVLEYLHSRSPALFYDTLTPDAVLIDAHSGEIKLRDVPANQGDPQHDVYTLATMLYCLATNDHASAQRGTFFHLSAIGVLGQVLETVLHQNARAHCDATALRQRLENLTPASFSQLRAPDSSLLSNEQALVRWCESHWQAAERWLDENLPNEIELWWGKTYTANKLRAITYQHNDRALALDAALAFLDPLDFGKALVSLDVDQREIDYGKLSIHDKSTITVNLSNKGRRCAVLGVDTPGWITADYPSTRLRPGDQVAINLNTQLEHVQLGGHVFGKIFIQAPSTMVLIDAYTSVSFWRVLWRKHYEAVYALLMMVGFCLLLLLFSYFK